MSSYMSQLRQHRYPRAKRISESPTYALTTGPRLKKRSTAQAMPPITRSQKARSISQKPLPPLPSCSQSQITPAEIDFHSSLIRSYTDALNEKAMTIATQGASIRQQEKQLKALREHVMQQYLLIETLQEDSEEILQQAGGLRQERDVLRTDNTELRNTVEEFGLAIEEMKRDLDAAYGLEKEEMISSDDAAAAVVLGLTTVTEETARDMDAELTQE